MKRFGYYRWYLDEGSGFLVSGSLFPVEIHERETLLKGIAK